MELRLSRIRGRVLKAVAWAGALVLSSMSAPRAEAGPIVMTGGRLYTDGSLAFRNVSVDLFGPEFVWFTSYFSNFMSFLGDPDPTLPHALGTDVEFDASITADGEFFENAEFPVGFLIFRGQDYLATGQIQVDTQPIPVGLGVVTVPFTLVGNVHGCTATGLESCGRGSETVDLSILASGTVHATVQRSPGRRWPAPARGDPVRGGSARAGADQPAPDGRGRGGASGSRALAPLSRNASSVPLVPAARW
jgi:hypothetical protein